VPLTGPRGFRPYSPSPTVGLEVSALGKKIEEDEQRFARAVGERAARLRKDRGITQKEMAERLGVSQPHVSFIENGETRLHGEMIAKLARTLGVSADELLGLKAPRPHSTATTSTRKFSRVLQQFSQLPERDQRAVVRLITSLLASHDDGTRRPRRQPDEAP
jgi:transcriptional regulator with XRE-family HTH domain